MSQSRAGSLAEAGVNILIGYSINFVANLLILPRFGYHVTVHDTFWIGIWFTGISLTRTYVIRRAVNSGAFRRWFSVKRWFPQKA